MVHVVIVSIPALLFFRSPYAPGELTAQRVVETSSQNSLLKVEPSPLIAEHHSSRKLVITLFTEGAGFKQKSVVLLRLGSSKRTSVSVRKTFSATKVGNIRVHTMHIAIMVLPCQRE